MVFCLINCFNALIYTKKAPLSKCLFCIKPKV